LVSKQPKSNRRSMRSLPVYTIRRESAFSSTSQNQYEYGGSGHNSSQTGF
jgi:hypothetical protein